MAAINTTVIQELSASYNFLLSLDETATQEQKDYYLFLRNQITIAITVQTEFILKTSDIRFQNYVVNPK